MKNTKLCGKWKILEKKRENSICSTMHERRNVFSTYWERRYEKLTTMSATAYEESSEQWGPDCSQTGCHKIWGHIASWLPDLGRTKQCNTPNNQTSMIIAIENSSCSFVIASQSKPQKPSFGTENKFNLITRFRIWELMYALKSDAMVWERLIFYSGICLVKEREEVMPERTPVPLGEVYSGLRLRGFLYCNSTLYVM